MKTIILIAIACLPAAVLAQSWTETFDDNNREWPMEGDKDHSREIASGKYILKTFKEGSGQFTSAPAFFDNKKDFTLEAVFVQRDGSINNGIGINGMCVCQIHAHKIFDDIPDFIQTPFGAKYVYFTDPVMYLRALFDCIDARVDVVNLSIGGGGRPSAPEAQAFQSLIANGTVVVAAMGNDRQQGSPISYPAAIPGPPR